MGITVNSNSGLQPFRQTFLLVSVKTQFMRIKIYGMVEVAKMILVVLVRNQNRAKAIKQSTNILGLNKIFKLEPIGVHD
jgi:hypothetical protein